MGLDQRANRLNAFLFFCLITVVCFAQEKPPFLKSDANKNKEYEFLYNEVVNSKVSQLEKINQRIRLASTYKKQKDVLVALEEKLILTGETAALYYLIAGTNGIIALQTSQFFSIPYVKAMMENFNLSLKIDPEYVPSYEGYVEALCMVPSLLGGDLNLAKQLAAKLEQMSPVEGHFAQGFIAKTLRDETAAKVHYAKAFDLLIQINFCDVDLSNFFASKSMNFPYKIAEVSAHFEIASTIGVCAIDYFIENYTPLYNLPLEWAYFRKAQLHLKLEEDAKAKRWINKALEINPNFKQAKQFKQNHQRRL